LLPREPAWPIISGFKPKGIVGPDPPKGSNAMFEFLGLIGFFSTLIISILFCGRMMQIIHQSFAKGGLSQVALSIRSTGPRMISIFAYAMVLGAILCFASAIFLISAGFSKNPSKEIADYAVKWAARPASAPLVTKEDGMTIIGGGLSFFAFVGSYLLPIGCIAWGLCIAYHTRLFFAARRMIRTGEVPSMPTAACSASPTGTSDHRKSGTGRQRRLPT
jgi:hypothetical protein